MFGFHDIAHGGDESGSEERFSLRKKIFIAKGKNLITHHFWWVMHNCVAHFLIGLMPIKFFFRFHDFTSIKLMDGVKDADRFLLVATREQYDKH